MIIIIIIPEKRPFPRSKEAIYKFKKFTYKLKMLLQIKNSTCKLKILQT